jgi:AraC-like DNA-binding protein
MIGVDPSARTTLDQMAAALHTSPFHLSRTFRRWTGCSIHTYRTRVRLRVGLDRIADGGRIADVALELGFASQSHFTDRLRRDLKLTPDAWRRALRGRHELSRILKEGEVSAA